MVSDNEFKKSEVKYCKQNMIWHFRRFIYQYRKMNSFGRFKQRSRKSLVCTAQTSAFIQSLEENEAIDQISVCKKIAHLHDMTFSFQLKKFSISATKNKREQN